MVDARDLVRARRVSLLHAVVRGDRPLTFPSFVVFSSGFQNSGSFHPVFGPALMVVYACLSNTRASVSLLPFSVASADQSHSSFRFAVILTVLVAILSKTFADISQDAAAESMFRKAVSTIEGVKSDAVSSYQAPFNLIAVVAMFPMKVRPSCMSTDISRKMTLTLSCRPDAVHPLAAMVPQGQRDPHQDLSLPHLARHLVSHNCSPLSAGSESDTLRCSPYS